MPEATTARAHHKKLHGKAKHVALVSQKLTRALSSSHPPDAAEIKSLVAQVRPLLASLRHGTLAANGPHAAAVASGLLDLSRSYSALAGAASATDLQSKMNQLIAGKQALDAAKASALKAGDAWPL
jgi:hypothetical protein